MILELIDNSKDVELKFTETAGGYWREDSVNSELDTKLWAELVPSSGDADTVHGELLRSASRLYRDMYQNGGGNLVSFEDNGYSCEHCNHFEYVREAEEQGEDYDEDHSDNCPDSLVISDYYQGMFDFLEKHLTDEGRKTLKEVEKQVLKQPWDIPIVFDRLVDHAIHMAQTTVNAPMEPTEV